MQLLYKSKSGLFPDQIATTLNEFHAEGYDLVQIVAESIRTITVDGLENQFYTVLVKQSPPPHYRG